MNHIEKTCLTIETKDIHLCVGTSRLKTPRRTFIDDKQSVTGLVTVCLFTSFWISSTSIMDDYNVFNPLSLCG